MGSTMRNFGAFGFAIVLTTFPVAGQERTTPALLGRNQAACAATALPDRLGGLTPQGDLILDAGVTAKLAAIRFPDEGPRRDEALSWLRAKAGEPILVQSGPERDRWNRMTVRIRLADGSRPVDLSHGLVEAGLAMVDPSATEIFCQPELLALEETARELSLGLWKDDGYKPIDVEGVESLRGRVGRFTLVEGRIRSVGERAQRTYLNFGGHWAEDFTIIIPKKTWKLMTDRGIDAVALKGQRIRARGILESWQGAAVTVVVPEMIERLTGDRLPR
jgi:hypothetical protein